MFYSRSLMLTNIRRRQRPLCTRQVYYIYVIQCSLLRTYMIAETTQCVAGLRGVSGHVLLLIRKSIRTHAYHSFGLLLKGFKITFITCIHIISFRYEKDLLTDNRYAKHNSI